MKRITSRRHPRPIGARWGLRRRVRARRWRRLNGTGKYAINIPVATGERLYTRWAFRELLEKQAADYIQPDLCHCGGFAEGRKIAALAEVYHVHLLPHNPNGPLSTLVGVHLGACTPNFEMLEYPRQPADQARLFKNMPAIKDGWIEVPEGPGWGVELDEEALAQFAPEE